MNTNKTMVLTVATSIALLTTTSAVRLCVIQKDQVINELTKHNSVLKKDNSTLKQDIEKITKNNNEDKLKIIKLKKENKILQQRLDEHEKKVSYNPYDLTTASNVSIKQLRKAFKDTKMTGLEQGFINAEKEYGVNAIFLASLVATESGWNDSDRAKDGSNNITGHAVYNDLSRGSYFNSKEECIMSTGKLIGEHYLNPKGEHYNGVSLWNVNQKYSLLPNKQVNHEWSKLINSISKDFVNKINN